MKKIKLLVMFVMFIVFSQIGLSNKLSQTGKNYIVDSEGNATEKTVQATEVHLRFNSDVPNLTDEQVSQLLKNGKIQFSEMKLKGRYEQFILFYVPMVEVDSCFLSEDGIVSYKGFEAKDQPRMFSWWFLLIIVGIVCMIINHIKRSNVVASLFVLASSFAIAFAFAFAFAIAFAFAFTFAIAFAFAFAIAAAVASNKKSRNVFIWMYYFCMVAACVFAYLQW